MKKFLLEFMLLSMFVVMSVAVPVSARSLNLQQAIDMALESNRAIEQSEEDRDMAKWELSAARRSSGANLTWQSSYGKIGGQYYKSYRNASNLPDYNTESTNSVNLTMPIYSGGSLESQRRSAGYALNESDLMLEDVRQSVKYQVAETYYQVLQNKDLIKVQDETINALQQHLNNVKIQYEVGTVAKSDLLATQVQLANVKQNLSTAWGKYDNSVATLNNLIGLPVNTALDLPDDLKYVPYGKNEVYCLKYALSHRADGIAALYEIKRANESIKNAKSNFKPKVNAVITGSMSGEQPFERNHSERAWSVGVQANWNVFDNGVTSARVRQAKSSKRKARSAANQQLEQIQLEVHNAYTNMKMYEDNIKTMAAAVTQAEEEYRITQVRYVEGVDSNLTVIDAQEKLTETRNNYYVALYNFNIAKAALERAMGVPVIIDAEVYALEEEDGSNALDALEVSALIEDNIDESGRIIQRADRDIADVVTFDK